MIAHLGYLIGEYKKAEDDAAGRIGYETERREDLKAQVATLTAERDAALARAEKAEARVVVPEDTLTWARRVSAELPGTKTGRAAKVILSLTDHLPETKEKVQSQHPEGTHDRSAAVAMVREALRGVQIQAPIKVYIYTGGEEGTTE